MSILFKTASASEELRMSAPVITNSVEFNTSTRTIMAYCADGNTRMCRIDRCASLALARSLFKCIRTHARLGLPLHYSAAGGNSPDRWFCDANKPKIEEADDLTLAAYFNS